MSGFNKKSNNSPNNILTEEKKKQCQSFILTLKLDQLVNSYFFLWNMISPSEVSKSHVKISEVQELPLAIPASNDIS